MLTLFLIDRAKADIRELHSYFVEHQSIQLADRFVQAIYASLHFLVEFPDSGAKHQSRIIKLQGIRNWTLRDFPRYVIYYRISGELLQILRVLHGSRKANKLLSELN